jgi:GNAT superfamily N-acetyltransferase
MTTPTIRVFQPTDEAEVTALFAEFNDFFPAIDPLGRSISPAGADTVLTKRMIRETASQSGTILVAEVGKEIVGFIAGIIQTQSAEELLENTPAKAGRVIELFVRSDAQNKGVGKALMQQMEPYFTHQGCGLIYIQVFVPNHHAYAFYQRLGYANRNIDLIKELK